MEIEYQFVEIFQLRVSHFFKWQHFDIKCEFLFHEHEIAVQKLVEKEGKLYIQYTSNSLRNLRKLFIFWCVNVTLRDAHVFFPSNKLRFIGRC